MWFPTVSKLDVALKKLLARMAVPLLGAEDALNESKVFDKILGPSVELQNFFAQGERVGAALLNLLDALRSGRVTVRDVNQRMATASAMVEKYEFEFLALSAARSAGANQADKLFESENAKD